MPWSRLRTHKAGDMGSLHRHSTVDPTMSDQEGEQMNPNDANHLGHNHHEADKSPSPLRNSFEPPAYQHATLSTEKSNSPNTQDHPPNRQRFSMLRFRHASDPQISKTARDQSLGVIPPMPAGKPLHDMRNDRISSCAD